jgi:hypothetical protein
MTEVRDERLDLMDAIEDASSDERERRRSLRIRRKVSTQMTPWTVGVAAVPFGVIIEDISESGVGIVHSEPIEAGKKFLLTVPRKFHGPLVIECVAVRCESRGHGLFNIGMVASQKIEHVEQTHAEMRLTSTRTRLLLLLFGVFGLAVAAFVPL